MMRYAVVYDRTERNYGAIVPMLPVVMVTARSLEELERRARRAIAAHLRGTPMENEPFGIDLVSHEDYDGDFLTLEGERIAARDYAAFA